MHSQATFGPESALQAHRSLYYLHKLAAVLQVEGSSALLPLKPWGLNLGTSAYKACTLPLSCN